MIRGHRSHSLYYLDPQVVMGENEINTENEAIKWHTRLGHIGEKGLSELVKQQLIPTSAKSKLKHCESYTLGKSTKLSYPKGSPFF